MIGKRGDVELKINPPNYLEKLAWRSGTGFWFQ